VRNDISYPWKLYGLFPSKTAAESCTPMRNAVDHELTKDEWESVKNDHPTPVIMRRYRHVTVIKVEGKLAPVK
jgi:hypothetical protein